MLLSIVSCKILKNKIDRKYKNTNKERSESQAKVSIMKQRECFTNESLLVKIIL